MHTELIRRVLIVTTILFVPTAMFSQGTNGKKNCNLALFSRELNVAIERGNAGKVALMVSYPLRVNDSRGSYYIKDAASLQGRFADIFTPEVRTAITTEQLDASNCDPAQFMYGRGNVWVAASDQGYAITAVNVPGESRNKSGFGRVEFTCRTNGHRIIVDLGPNGKPRFRAWDTGHSLMQKPDTEVLNGKASIEGTGSCSYRIWSFNRGDKQVSVEGLGCFPDSNTPPSMATGQFVTSEGAASWCF